MFWAVMGLMVIVAIASAGMGYKSGALHSGPAFVATSQTIAKEPTLPGFKVTWTGTGDLSVPDQIAPGTYVVAANDRTVGCGWQVLSGKKVPRRAGLMAPGAASVFVTVEKNDGYLRLMSCAFQKVQQ